MTLLLRSPAKAIHAAGFIHLFFEAYFVIHHETLAGSQELFGQLWKEYSLSDSRYLTSDAFLVTMEAVTAVGGPGCANGNQNMLTIQPNSSAGDPWPSLLPTASQFSILHVMPSSFCSPSARSMATSSTTPLVCLTITSTEEASVGPRVTTSGFITFSSTSSGWSLALVSIGPLSKRIWLIPSRLRETKCRGDIQSVQESAAV